MLRFSPYSIEEDAFFPVIFIVGVVSDFEHVELLFGGLDKAPVSASSALEAEVADSMRAQEIVEGLNEQRKCRFEVDAVCSQDDVRMMGDSGRNRLSPVQDDSTDRVVQVVIGDVLLHEMQHGDLISDVEGVCEMAGSCDSKAN